MKVNDVLGRRTGTGPGRKESIMSNAKKFEVLLRSDEALQEKLRPRPMPIPATRRTSAHAMQQREPE